MFCHLSSNFQLRAAATLAHFSLLAAACTSCSQNKDRPELGLHVVSNDVASSQSAEILLESEKIRRSGAIHNVDMERLALLPLPRQVIE